jgi:serine/threonine-protein kinase
MMRCKYGWSKRDQRVGVEGQGPGGVPFGRYLIRKRLAKGGMGEVFLADQLGPLGPVRPVALKRMLPRLARDAHSGRRFLDEMATAAQLNHPNIATTYDFGEVEGAYFIAMEFIDGLSLADLIKQLGPLPVGAALAIAARVAGALAYAHGRRTPEGEPAPVVHRDVSPHNVMISSAGAVKLLDFGIARGEAETQAGRLEGKIAYAAPEQLQGARPDRRADLWALGVVLYEALTGARPFVGETALQVVVAAVEGRYQPLAERRMEARPAAQVVERALAAEPSARWSTAEEFRAACAFAMAGLEFEGDGELASLIAAAGGPKKSALGTETISEAKPIVLTQTVGSVVRLPGAAVAQSDAAPADATPRPPPRGATTAQVQVQPALGAAPATARAGGAPRTRRIALGAAFALAAAWGLALALEWDRSTEAVVEPAPPAEAHEIAAAAEEEAPAPSSAATPPASEEPTPRPGAERPPGGAPSGAPTHGTGLPARPVAAKPHAPAPLGRHGPRPPRSLLPSRPSPPRASACCSFARSLGRASRSTARSSATARWSTSRSPRVGMRSGWWPDRAASATRRRRSRCGRARSRASCWTSKRTVWWSVHPAA